MEYNDPKIFFNQLTVKAQLFCRMQHIIAARGMTSILINYIKSFKNKSRRCNEPFEFVRQELNGNIMRDTLTYSLDRVIDLDVLSEEKQNCFKRAVRKQERERQNFEVKTSLKNFNFVYLEWKDYPNTIRFSHGSYRIEVGHFLDYAKLSREILDHLNDINVFGPNKAVSFGSQGNNNPYFNLTSDLIPAIISYLNTTTLGNASFTESLSDIGTKQRSTLRQDGEVINYNDFTVYMVENAPKRL